MNRRPDRARWVVERPRPTGPPPAGRFGRRWPPRRLRQMAWRSPIGIRGVPGILRVRGVSGIIRPGVRRWPHLPRPGRPWAPRSARARLLCALGVLAAFGAGTWVAAHSPLLDVDRIEVWGGFQVTAEQAVEAARVERGEPLLGIDEARARARLEALPWVLSARVERVFPNRLRIRLTERLAAASVARPAGGFALLDETARVLADRVERPEGVPEVSGAGTAPTAGRWLRLARPALRVVAALPEALRRRVSAAFVDGEAVGLRLGEAEVRFGPPEQLEAKAAALSALFEHLGDRPVRYVDVRVPGAPVVGPAEPTPQAAPAGAGGAGPGLSARSPRAARLSDFGRFGAIAPSARLGYSLNANRRLLQN